MTTIIKDLRPEGRLEHLDPVAGAREEGADGGVLQRYEY